MQSLQTFYVCISGANLLLYISLYKQLRNKLVFVSAILATLCDKHFLLLLIIPEAFALVFLQAPLLNLSGLTTGCYLDPKSFHLKDELAEELHIVQHLIWKMIWQLNQSTSKTVPSKKNKSSRKGQLISSEMLITLEQTPKCGVCCSSQGFRGIKWNCFEGDLNDMIFFLPFSLN